MMPTQDNRFEDFFADAAYVRLKNHLYNYLLRKRAVGRSLQCLGEGRILEVGSGLSPMVTDSRRVVYSELSWRALRILKMLQPKGLFVVADACRLPFKDHSFTAVVCSEVLEHLPDDLAALRQASVVLRPGGSLVLTFPHRRGYFSADDRFVRHCRRYELSEMRAMLQSVGLRCMEIRKVLGVLEKAVMMVAVAVISLRGRRSDNKGEAAGMRNHGGTILPLLFKGANRLLCVPMRLEAAVTPQPFSTVLLIRAEKPLNRAEAPE
jgi:SAM-dependent methyltransferase